MYYLLTILFNALGMGVRDFKGNSYGKIGRFYNMSFLLFYMVLLSFGFCGYFTVNYTQNTFTTASFWFQYLGLLTLAVKAIIQSLRSSGTFQKVHNDIDELTDKCSNFGKPIKVSTRLLTITTLAVLGSAGLSFILEIIFFRQYLNFVVLWIGYVPGIATSIYIFYMSYLQQVVTDIYAAINEHMIDFGKDMNWNEKLMQKIDAKKSSPINVEHLNEVFHVYNLLYKTTKEIKRYCMATYVIFLSIATNTFVFYAYMTVMDLLGIRTGRGINFRDHLFTEYWAYLFWPGIFVMSYSSHMLINVANESSAALHNVRSVFSNISEHASVYALQLMFTDVTPNYGFFEIDFSIIMTIVGMGIKYTFIFVHFNIANTEIE